MRWTCALLFLAATALECGGGGSVAPGHEKGPCFPNGTCETGLSCFSSICVRYDAGGAGAAGSPGAAGAAGMSGAAGAMGVAGTTGAAGATSGAPGTAGHGTSGSAGGTGSTGAVGTSSAAGSGGAAGSAGAAGTSGAAGSGGAAGSAGAAGTTGASGASGDSGTTTCADAGAASADAEELTVGACGYSPTLTTGAYSGYVIMTVSGLYVNSPGDPLQDAFYGVSLADNSMSAGPCPGCFVYDRASEGSCVCATECASTSHAVSDLLAQPYPAFSPSHVYTVKLNLGTAAAQPLNFGMADCGCGDNSGTHVVTLTPSTADACIP